MFAGESRSSVSESEAEDFRPLARRGEAHGLPDHLLAGHPALREGGRVAGFADSAAARGRHADGRQPVRQRREDERDD
jgi:hypothetical protein